MDSEAFVRTVELLDARARAAEARADRCQAENARLVDARRAAERELEEERGTRERLSALLGGVCDALKGPHPLGGWHSWHDLPELAAQVAARARGGIALSPKDTATFAADVIKQGGDA